MQRTLSMRRLAAVTVVMFVLVLAFLGGRVRAGADPAQAGARPAAPGSVPGYGAPGDVGPSGDPSAGAPGDGFPIPDDDPPATHAS
jgi:hypothetical protein